MPFPGPLRVRNHNIQYPCGQYKSINTVLLQFTVRFNGQIHLTYAGADC